MDIKDKESIACAAIPRIEELRCITCEIDFIDVVQNSVAKSIYHWQIIKCRLIIHILPEVIASPIPGTDNFLFIIATKEYFATGKLYENLRALNMLFGIPQPVTIDAYTVCLQYTIECKLAPMWNRVVRYYVQGQNFYTPAEELNALKMHISIDDGRAFFRLKSRKIKIPSVYLEDFHLLRSSIVDFLTDNNGSINLSEYSQSVYVLPNMNKGKVVSVFKKIPLSCPFKDYTQLRRHWKNMYGYRLPKIADGITYYEIKFPVLSANNFIYPSTCVASKQIQRLPCTDTGYIISQFIHDIRVTIPEVLSKPFHISHSHKNQNTEFFSLNEYESNIQNKLSPSGHEESFSIDTSAQNINKMQQSELLSNYERWLLTDPSKSTYSILKSTKPLSTVEQIHVTSRSIAIDSKTDGNTDETSIINSTKANLFKYNDARAYATFPCNDNQSNATFLNSEKLKKKEFQTFETDTASLLHRTSTHCNKSIKLSTEINRQNQIKYGEHVAKFILSQATRSSKIKDKKFNVVSKIKKHI